MSGYPDAPTPWTRSRWIGSEHDNGTERTKLWDAEDRAVTRVLGEGHVFETLMDGLLDISAGRAPSRAFQVGFPGPWNVSCGIVSDAAGRRLLSFLSTRGSSNWEDHVAHQLVSMVNPHVA